MQDDEEPAGAEYKPDGGYIPRIIYLEPSTGEPRTDIYNTQGSEKYKYLANVQRTLLSFITKILLCRCNSSCSWYEGRSGGLQNSSVIINAVARIWTRDMLIMQKGTNIV